MYLSVGFTQEQAEDHTRKTLNEIEGKLEEANAFAAQVAAGGNPPIPPTPGAGGGGNPGETIAQEDLDSMADIDRQLKWLATEDDVRKNIDEKGVDAVRNNLDGLKTRIEALRTKGVKEADPLLVECNRTLDLLGLIIHEGEGGPTFTETLGKAKLSELVKLANHPDLSVEQAEQLGEVLDARLGVLFEAAGSADFEYKTRADFERKVVTPTRQAFKNLFVKVSRNKGAEAEFFNAFEQNVATALAKLPEGPKPAENVDHEYWNYLEALNNNDLLKEFDRTDFTAEQKNALHEVCRERAKELQEGNTPYKTRQAFLDKHAAPVREIAVKLHDFLDTPEGDLRFCFLSR